MNAVKRFDAFLVENPTYEQKQHFITWQNKKDIRELAAMVHFGMELVKGREGIALYQSHEKCSSYPRDWMEYFCKNNNEYLRECIFVGTGINAIDEKHHGHQQPNI